MRIHFSVVKKMVLGITAVSSLTYGTSAFFIFVLKDWFTQYVSDWLFIAGTLALGIFWTGFLGWIAAKWFVDPLLQLTQAANMASEGNLQVAITPSKSDDELRTLGLSFQNMIDNLRQMVQQINTSFQATDTHEDEIRNAIGHAAEHIMQITATMEDILQGAERQFQSSEATFTAIEQMTTTAEHINEKATNACILTRRMKSTMEESTMVFHSLVNGMRKLTASNRQLVDHVRHLENNANQITAISKVVGDFASQTHLLALNASIEAARAGEHGLGFAVVAGEVRTLAEQSSEAVQHINELIGLIGSDINSVANKIREQNIIADTESAHGESTATALQNISQEAAVVSHTVEGIASMISSQQKQVQSTLDEARNVAEIAAKICSGAKEVFSSTQQQTAVMQEIAASSDLLRKHSSKLREQIHIFKVG